VCVLCFFMCICGFFFYLHVFFCFFLFFWSIVKCTCYPIYVNANYASAATAVCLKCQEIVVFSCFCVGIRVFLRFLKVFFGFFGFSRPIVKCTC
jgi:hypothetical protein